MSNVPGVETARLPRSTVVQMTESHGFDSVFYDDVTDRSLRVSSR
jgi:hypothetical protein